MAIDIKSTTIHHRVSGGGQLVVTSVEQQLREWVKGGEEEGTDRN